MLVLALGQENDIQLQAKMSKSMSSFRSKWLEYPTLWCRTYAAHPHSFARVPSQPLPPYSCLIRDILKAASTDTAQITSTENQLCFSFICHPFFFIVSCMKECESTKLETEKQRDNLCIDVYDYILQKTASQ